MTFYKLLHKPTGLFFRPSKYLDKRNLAVKGKVYHSKPSIKWLGGIYHHPLDLEHLDRRKWEIREVIESDWEVKKYEVEDED